MADGEMIDLDMPTARRLKNRYEKARGAGEESFTLDGKEWVTRYAHYVLEYVSGAWDVASLMPAPWPSEAP